jgi:hypothetical protein
MSRELTIFINFSRVSHLFPRINSRRIVSNNSREKMRDSGKVNKNCQLPILASFPENKLPKIQLLDHGFEFILEPS